MQMSAESLVTNDREVQRLLLDIFYIKISFYVHYRYSVDNALPLDVARAALGTCFNKKTARKDETILLGIKKNLY